MGKLEAKNIEKYFKHDGKQLKTLDGINLNVNDGEFVCIVGTSGCGKSTFLRTIAGLETPDSGKILLDGQPLSDTGPDRIMVFQEGALFPWLNVQDNVEYGLKVAGIPKEKRNEMITNPKIDAFQLMLTDLRTRNESIRHKAAFRGCQPEFQSLVTTLIDQLESQLNEEKQLHREKLNAKR